MNWFRNRSIFTKVISGYALTALVLVAGGLAAMSRQAALNATVHQLGFEDLRGMQHLGAARPALLQARLQELQHIAAAPADKPTYEKAKAE